MAATPVLAVSPDASSKRTRIVNELGLLVVLLTVPAAFGLSPGVQLATLTLLDDADLPLEQAAPAPSATSGMAVAQMRIKGLMRRLVPRSPVIDSPLTVR